MDAPAAISSRARHLALAGVVGPAAFALAAVVSATRVDADPASHPGAAPRSGYSHVHQFVSELAARGSEARPIMTAGFLVFGVAILVFARSLRVLWPTATVLAVVVALSGVATLGAGTFACDPGCPTSGTRSTSQQLHDVVSVVGFVAWIAAALVAGWRSRTTPYGRAALALGAVQLAAAGVLATFAPRAVDDPVGLVQRVLLGAVGAWFVLTAVALRTGRPISDDLERQPGRGL